MLHLAKHSLFNATQHDFRSGRSTLTNLIEYYESILLLLEKNQSVDAIYLDYSKAFDKCDHNVILDKLDTLGIRGKINIWIEAFLKRRQQIVVVRGEKSDPVWCTSGVPQGSVLGPLLFLILMHDITKGIHHSILSSFADDTKIWKAIGSTRDEVLLQDDLDMIYVWAANNNMQFNSDKFQAVRFSFEASKCYYNDDSGEEIGQHDNLKDLGIYVSSNLSFDHHTRLVVNKGKRMSGWICRTFRTRSPGVMLTLLKQLIYPTIEYNSILWDPNSQDLINLLESVQNNFLKQIHTPNINSKHDYWDRLRVFKLYSLQRRRERYAIIYAWKVIHGIYPNPGLSFNQVFENHKEQPNQGIQLDIHQRDDITIKHDTNPPKWLERHSVLEKCCELYNTLPLSLRQMLPPEEEPSLEKFKTQLDEWIEKIPDQPTIPACRWRPAKTNSIMHQIEYINQT